MMKRTRGAGLRTLWCAALAGVILFANAASAKIDDATLDKSLDAVASYKIGDSRTALTDVEAAVVDAARDAKQAAALARRLAKLLESDAATDDAKDFVCRQLWIIGTAEQVPVLTKMLANPRLSHMARYALQRIPDPAVDQALRASLGRLSGPQLVGVVNSIGERRSEKATADLVKLLGHKDPLVASSAAAALGKIGGTEAAAAIGEARQNASASFRDELTSVWLTCADALVAASNRREANAIYRELRQSSEPAHVRIAALRGQVAARNDAGKVRLLSNVISGNDDALKTPAVRHLEQVGGAEATEAIVTLLDSADDNLKVQLLDALHRRRDKSAAPAVTALATSAGSEPVRTAAVTALAGVGDASTIGVLTGVIKDTRGGSVLDAARNALASLPGPDINRAILNAVNKSSDDKVRTELIRSLGARGADDQTDALIRLAATTDSPAVRNEALRVLGDLAEGKHLSPLVDLLVAQTDASSRSAAEKTVATVATRIEGKSARVAPILAAHASTDGETRASLLRVLGRIGGEKALAAARADLKHNAEPVRDAAVRALADWPDAAVLDDLWELARNAPSRTHQLLALRGYIRLIGVADMPNGRKIELYQQALTQARRADEKRLALAGLAEIGSQRSLEAVQAYSNDAEIAEEAKQAAQKIRQAINRAAKSKGDAPRGKNRRNK